jgi:membrane protein YdbS with pleckstrin-like domain
MFLDNQTNKPSITLTYSIMSFLVAIVSVAARHWFVFSWTATSAAIILWFLSTVLYIIRKINKASFDVDDKEFSIENTESENPVLAAKV